MLTLIRGLPGSGKTTLARQIARATGAVHVEADQYFETDTIIKEYRFDPAKLGDAHRWSQQRAQCALRAGKHCVVSNTFTQRWELQPYIAMAREFNTLYKIITATGQWPNVHGVPDKAIARMRVRWQEI
jgi:predicted kinase